MGLQHRDVCFFFSLCLVCGDWWTIGRLDDCLEAKGAAEERQGGGDREGGEGGGRRSQQHLSGPKNSITNITTTTHCSTREPDAVVLGGWCWSDTLKMNIGLVDAIDL